ncbi:MAG: 50S ribosomal protein L29 [bacterium]|nr:50S ribosomal protein L29 [bacterium]
MKNIISEYTNKEVGELQKDLDVLKQEIAKLSLEKGIKPHKDSNAIAKKKRTVAMLLTVMQQKKLGINK